MKSDGYGCKVSPRKQMAMGMKAAMLPGKSAGKASTAKKPAGAKKKKSY